jgi:hypothetical protein
MRHKSNSVRKGGKKNQCGMCKKYGHNTRTCTVRMRHDEIQQRRKTSYREHAANTDCNLDRVMFLLCDCLAYI